ncbi:calmodulin-binding protein [Dorcoceras hygrometricum]|uniref:Calmodulin-binding protein n=1 Tax=Dorcoceras hygrometricum TaxID=472368 RepID=A0A2Z7BUU6_9LAMI|nr:calmodulin-binding protein [Dorcoceras hygrometricum]
MTFRVVRTNQYNQDLGLIHSTNGNHLESSKEGSSIDHQVTIYLHAQNITMLPTNETCPRPDTRLLRHPALEVMTRSTRTDSPRRIGRKRFSGEEEEAAARGGGGGGGAWREEGRRSL